MKADVKELVNKFLEVLSRRTVYAQVVSTTINKAYGSNVHVTAPTVSGYQFLCWAQVTTNGWVGSAYPSTPLNQSSPIWIASSGQSGTGQIDCLALYVPN